MSTWAERATRFVGDVIAAAAAERPGDAAHAIARLRASTVSWGRRHYAADSRTGLKALGAARAAAVAMLRAGRWSPAPEPRPCGACGAPPGEACRVMGGEIAPGEVHEARKEVARG